MYPRTFFSLIPPFPRTKRVFVAMSFEPRFDDRWKHVLAPAIRDLQHQNQQLEPFRVDLSRTSDAILTEILAAIGDSHCIVADITAVAEVDGRPLRNANVLYEVGLAHSARLPEEVVLFRSDQGPLDFDIAGVRVHTYDPDNEPERARGCVSETIVASLAALDARRRIVLRMSAERLTLPAANLLFECLANDEIHHPESRTVVQALGAVQRSASISLLLELGAIRAKLLKVTPELLNERGDDPSLQLLTYAPTPLGKALAEYLGHEMGTLEPGMKAHIEALMNKPPVEGEA